MSSRPALPPPTRAAACPTVASQSAQQNVSKQIGKSPSVTISPSLAVPTQASVSQTALRSDSAGTTVSASDEQRTDATLFDQIRSGKSSGAPPLRRVGLSRTVLPTTSRAPALKPQSSTGIALYSNYLVIYLLI
jgi:hypothetical protein